MFSKMLWMVSRVLTGFANTPEANNYIPHDMPNELTEQIRKCQVTIPAVLKEMHLAVNTLFAAKRDVTGASEHKRPALRMKTPQ